MAASALPDGKVALIEPDWVGKLAGFTLLFEALVLLLAQQMPFAAVARIVGEGWHRVGRPLKADFFLGSFGITRSPTNTCGGTLALRMLKHNI
jgi:hypothetical protein